MSRELVATPSDNEKKESSKTWKYDEFQDEDFADMFKSHNVPEQLQEKILNLRNILDRNVIVDGKQEIMNGTRNIKQLTDNLQNRINAIEEELRSQKPENPITNTLILEEKIQLIQCLKDAAKYQGRELCMNIISLYNKRLSEVRPVVYDKYKNLVMENIKTGKWHQDTFHGDYSQVSNKYPEILNGYLPVFDETELGVEIFELIKSRPRFAKELLPLFNSQNLDTNTKQKLLKVFYSLRNTLPHTSKKTPKPIDFGLKDRRLCRILDSANPEKIISNLEENKEWCEKLLALLPEGGDRRHICKTLEGHAVVIVEKYFDGVMIRIDHSPEAVLVGGEEREDTKIEFKPYHLVIHSSGLVDSDLSNDWDIRFDSGYLLRENDPVNEITLICDILDVVIDNKIIDIAESCGFTNYVLNTNY